MGKNQMTLITRARPSLPRPVVMLLGLCVTLGLAGQALAADWHVDASASSGGTGSSDDPFATIAEGMAAAMPGDTVIVRAGTYEEQLASVRDGGEGSVVTVAAAGGDEGDVIVQHEGRTLEVTHSFHTFRGIVFDGLFGAGIPVSVDGSPQGLTFEGCEIRNAARDCVDIGNASSVTFDGCRIHHCLRWDGERVDAHAITGAGVTGLTVRGCEIYQFSGDAIQLAPSRDFWDELLVESTVFWLAPIEATPSGYPEGLVPGENAFDSKTPDTGPRSRALFRNVTAFGFRSAISNQAAFNVKENVEVTIDGVTVYDSEIAFRLRHPALVTVMNAVVHGCDTAVRYEDGITDLEVFNCTFGGGVDRAFNAASSDIDPAVLNCLFLGDGLPAEAASDASNMTADASLFQDAAGHDYHLAAGSAAVDAGVTLAQVLHDRDGVARPQGAGYDVGAYEWTDSPPPDEPWPEVLFEEPSLEPADGGDVTVPDTTVDSVPSDVADAAVDGGDEAESAGGGCGCSLVR
jgi:hypothetical protein